MRVLIINSFFSTGGPPRIVRGIYDTLVEQGHDCVVAATRNEPVPGMSVRRVSGRADVYRAAVQSRLLDREGLSAKGATRRFVEWADRFDPDVVNLHNLHGYYVNYEVLFDWLKAAGKPVVWTLHDCWSFTGHCAYFSYEKCAQWETHCAYERPCPQKREYPSCVGLSRARRNFDDKRRAFCGVPDMTVVTPSEWLAGLARRSFLGAYPVRVIHNGIDLDEFRDSDGSTFRARHGLVDKRIVVGVAQNWEERKGFEDFMRLTELLGDGFQVVMVGLTDDQLSRLPEGVLGLKRTESIAQLTEIYSAADVFVNCTYQDNFPTVNIEALACGTPVMTYDTGGSPEAIDETCGAVVPQGDVEGMAQAVRDAVASPFRAEDCLRRSQLFDRKARYSDYINLFKEVCAR